jgi:phosphoglycolate phosphatase-like HAD superfamily hydrolase
VTYETKRSSVPVEQARSELVLKAYPFPIELLSNHGVLARHERCFGQKQDVFDPLHYVVLLEQRPGALEYAKPLRHWRQDWPASSHLLLRRLREQWPEGRGVKALVQGLRVHQQYPARQLEQAVEQAITSGCAHFDGVKHCLEHLGQEADRAPLLALTDRPHLALVGTQPLDLHWYDQLRDRSAPL